MDQVDMSERSCAIEGCEATHRLRRGMCNAHYRRWLQRGTTDLERLPKAGRVCSVDGCAHEVNGQGYCRTHYTRWTKHGDPQAHIPVATKTQQGDRCSRGCDSPPLARGLCAMHYSRWAATGDPGEAGRRWHLTDPGSSEKACSKCGVIKPKSEFHRSPKIRDGRASSCKGCAAKVGRNARFKRKYGITADDYDRLMAEQGGVCRICGDPPGPRGLVVDHCHKDGHVRGLLCNNCNALLGMANDEVDRLAAAIKYLEMSQK